MTPVELSRTVLCAVRRAVDAGELRVDLPERVVVAPPGPGGCGDFATNVALQLAKPAGRPPLEVARILRGHLLRIGRSGPHGTRSGTPADLPGTPDGRGVPAAPGGPVTPIADVSITGPGFLNFRLRSPEQLLVRLVRDIRERGTRYGWALPGPGGSDTPAAPGAPDRRPAVLLHAPREIRALVLLDVVARLLLAQGADVRTSCDAAPDPRWVDVLGVRSPAVGAADGAQVLRPVPAGSADAVLALGRDAGRWALLRPAAHDAPRLGDRHLVQRESNPLFRVRYAHARTRALLRNAADLGFAPDVPEALREAPAAHAGEDPGETPGSAVLAAPQALVTSLVTYPDVLARAASLRAPDRVARHLVGLADAVLAFLPSVLPAGEEKPSAAHRARLALAEAAGTVLAGGLSLLGIDAPDHL